MVLVPQPSELTPHVITGYKMPGEFCIKYNELKQITQEGMEPCLVWGLGFLLLLLFGGLGFWLGFVGVFFLKPPLGGTT